MTLAVVIRTMWKNKVRLRKNCSNKSEDATECTQIAQDQTTCSQVEAAATMISFQQIHDDLKKRETFHAHSEQEILGKNIFKDKSSKKVNN